MMGFVPGLPLQMLSRELGNMFELGFRMTLYKLLSVAVWQTEL